MANTIESFDADNTTTRLWDIDLSVAGKVYSRKTTPTNRVRQKIVCFLGREGDIERFSVAQTVPIRGDESAELPTPAQTAAVSEFFLECCETRFQAHTMLCARDYASVVANKIAFPKARRHLIWLGTAAFILSKRDLRESVRSWILNSGYGGIETGIAYHRPYKLASSFALKLVDDMRSSEAEIFG